MSYEIRSRLFINFSASVICQGHTARCAYLHRSFSETIHEEIVGSDWGSILNLSKSSFSYSFRH